jgi:hypothetical protein
LLLQPSLLLWLLLFPQQLPYEPLLSVPSLPASLLLSPQLLPLLLPSLTPHPECAAAAAGRPRAAAAVVPGVLA